LGIIQFAKKPVVFTIRLKGKPINTTHHHSWSSPRIRLARYLLPLIIFGLAVYLLLPQIETLEDSINVIRSMSVWLIGLAVIAQVCSYLGSGYLLQVIVDLGPAHLSIVRGALITLAAYSVGLVAGGWVGAAAATYLWIEKSEDNSQEAALAGVLPTLYNNAVLILVTVIGVVYLLTNHRLSSTQAVTYAAFLALLGLAIGVVIYGIRHQHTVEGLVLGIASRLMHLLRRPYNETSLRNVMDNIFLGLALLRKRGWLRPLLGSVMNNGFDMLTLYLLFIAARYPINLGVMVAGYGLAFLLGKAAFLFPGGVGVIESGMVAIYTNLGIPASICVVVVLGYRLLSFWLPTLFGFAAYGYLQQETSAYLKG